jgi:hypothetical protein
MLFLYISNGEKGAQQASIHALSTLFLAAPDHADQLVSDCLPALCDILEDVHRSLEVYIESLALLTDIARRSPHSIIIDSGVIRYLIEWLRWGAFLPALVDFYYGNITSSIVHSTASPTSSADNLSFKSAG